MKKIFIQIWNGLLAVVFPMVLFLCMPALVNATTTVPWIQKAASDVFMVPAQLNGSNLRVLIGQQAEPLGSTFNDLLDIASSSANDFNALGIWNTNSGACASAEYDANNNLSTLSTNYASFGITGGGFTGSGCVNNPFPVFGANSMYTIVTNGNMNFAMGSTSASAQFRWLTDTNGDGAFTSADTKMILTQSGQLGIGSTTPDAPLTISNNLSSFAAPQNGTELHIAGSGINSRITLDTYNTGITGAIFQGRSANGTNLAPTPPEIDKTLAGFSGDGYGTSGFHNISLGGTFLKTESIPFTNTSAASYLSFWTSATTTVTSLERMRISGAGNVGIGTTTPQSKLSIAQTTTGNGAVGLVIDGVVGTANADLALNRASAGSTEANLDFDTAGVEQWQLGLQNNSTNDFELWDGNDVPAFTINHTSLNVGIGTTSPYAALSVVGATGVVAGKYTATSTVASSFIDASTTALTVSGVASTSQLRIDSLTSGNCLNITNGLVGSVSCGSSLTNGSVGLDKIATSTLNANGLLWFNNTTGLITGTSTVLTVGRIIATSSIASSLPFASTTALSNTGVASTSVLRIDSLADGCLNITSGLVASTACSSGGGSNSKWATSTPNVAIYPNGATWVGIGTTTPRFNLQLASSTAPQLALSTGNATDPHWTMRNTGGTLFIGTSSPTTFATNTPSALSLSSTGSALLGIGTSSPFAVLSVVNNLSSAQPLFAVSSSTLAASAMPNFEIDKVGHPFYSGPVPACDGNCTFVAGNDAAFRVTTGTAKTSMTVTFANSWGTVSPVCIANEGGAGTVTVTASSTPTTVVISALSVLTGNDIEVQCMGIQ